MTILNYLQAIEDTLKQTGYEIQKGNLLASITYHQAAYNLINQVHAQFKIDPLLEWTLSIYKEQYDNYLIRLHFDKILVLMSQYLDIVKKGDIKNAGAFNAEINHNLQFLLNVYQNACLNKSEHTINFALIPHNLTIVSHYFSKIVTIHNQLIAMHNKVIFASDLINNAISNFSNNQKALGLDHLNQDKTIKSATSQFGQFWNPIKLPIKASIQPPIESSEEVQPTVPSF